MRFVTFLGRRAALSAKTMRPFSSITLRHWKARSLL